MKRVHSVTAEKIVQLKKNYPGNLFPILAEIAEKYRGQLYLVGGSVRDCLLGVHSNDLDIAVPHNAIDCAKTLVRKLGCGTFVDISGPDDEGGRVVVAGVQVDVAEYRGGAQDICEDLRYRDFSCNAMAIPVQQLIGDHLSPELIDPMSGLEDLDGGVVKHCPGAFTADPVRMLRGYRLCAVFGFTMDAATISAVEQHAPLINNVAMERIGGEMRYIFESPRTTQIVRAMGETGLLGALLPELYAADGVEQPGFHHLDVLGHCFLTLEMMERIIADPGNFFHDCAADIDEYLGREGVVRCLKWAALMHDIGKPETKKISEDKGGRATFYNHDEVGMAIFNRLAERLRWSRVDTKMTGALIGMHMHPFHLCNVQRDEPVSKRAALKLCHRAGDDLLGLFLLAMSDSLAGSGEMKPEGMEEELEVLLHTVLRIYEENIKPVLSSPRLLTGGDLIAEFGIEPGPLFSVVLGELEIAQVEGIVVDRESALSWVKKFMEENQTDD